MLTKKRRREIKQLQARAARATSKGFSEYGVISDALHDLLNHIEETEAANRIMKGWINYELPQVCEQHEVKLVIKKGRLYCPKGHEIHVG